MIPDADNYRAANLLIRQLGEDAPVAAAMHADEVPENGDEECRL
jgi:hypothetical protein